MDKVCLKLSPILLNRWKLEIKPRAQCLFFRDFALSVSLLVPRILKFLTATAGLLTALATAVHAQTSTVPVTVTTPLPYPRLLLKAGLRLTHLFYLPDARSWQLVLPSSMGVEYRLAPRFSLYLQAEADISAGRAGRGRRTTLPTPTTDLSMGVRYYFNQPGPASSQASPKAEAWGNYLALESSAELTQGNRRGRQARGSGSITPALFALCGTQHSGPGHRLLYDLSAGLGLQAPSSSTTESTVSRPWDVAAQVNLRVYFVNHRRAPKLAER